MTEQITPELAKLVQRYQDALRKHDEIAKRRQASFVAILQESKLELEERDGNVKMSFLLPDAFSVGVPSSTIQAVSNDLLQTLQEVEPGKNYTLTMREIQIGSTKLGTEGEIRIGHPSNYTGPQKLHSDLRLNYTSLYGSHYTTGSPASI